MARAATEDPKLENGTAQGSEEQLLAGPLPDSPLAEGQSPFEALRRKREGIEVEKQIQLEIPGYEGNLAARYKSLGYREIRKQAKRIASKGGDEAENEVTYAATVIARMCETILYRASDEDQLRPIHEFAEALGDEPVRFDERLAETVLGIEGVSGPAQIVRLVFRNQYAVLDHFGRLDAWLRESSGAGDQDF